MSYSKWLVFFSSLPTKPVGNRVRIWRRLVKSGAVQLKGAAYLLPSSEEHVEFLQWLTQEVESLGGEAAFVRTDRIDTMADADVIALFEVRKRGDYRLLAERLDIAERRIEGNRQGATSASLRKLAADLAKIQKLFDEIRRTDFFGSAAGAQIERRLAKNVEALHALRGAGGAPARSAEVERRSADTYRGRRWVTRSKPFVDRMASAWLIRKYVDPTAEFGFLADSETAARGAKDVWFDVAGGDFSHHGDLCTFEVLIRSFDLRDAALAPVAQIVHELDVADGRYSPLEAAGVAGILTGIVQVARDDADALERGMAVFELLHAAKSRSKEAARGTDPILP